MYCPPESGIIAPSSAYAKAPKNEMTPAITQTPRIIMGDGSSRAIVPGTMKIPTPIVVPITIQVESSRLSSRGRSAGACEAWIHMSLNRASPSRLSRCPAFPIVSVDADPQTGYDVLVDEPGNDYRVGRKGDCRLQAAAKKAANPCGWRPESAQL